MSNDLWQIESGDPSVGIFGASIWHECSEDSGIPTEETETIKSGEWVIFRTTFTCPACGATKAIEEKWPANMMEEEFGPLPNNEEQE